MGANIAHIRQSRLDSGLDFNVKDLKTFKLTAGARVLSLLDGTSKMSKSDPADGSRINLLDTPEEIAKKIKRCKVLLLLLLLYYSQA